MDCSIWVSGRSRRPASVHSAKHSNAWYYKELLDFQQFVAETDCPRESWVVRALHIGYGKEEWKVTNQRLPLICPRSRDAMEHLSNEQLLEQVASHQDSDAYQILFYRLGGNALALAQYLVRDPAKAEEAVQEAMLSVWVNANKFEAKRGTAKAWILRIVANKAIQDNRKAQRERIIEMEVQKEFRKQFAVPQFTEDQRVGLLATVRKEFSELPETLKQILALYYVGNLSQVEISAALGIPQRTISLRIRQGIDELRDRLERSGYAVALPLVSIEKMSELITQKADVPSSLSTRILQRLDMDAAESLPLTALAHGRSIKWLALTAGAIVVATACAWSYFRTSGSMEFTGLHDEKPGSQPSPGETAEGRLWTFDSAGSHSNLSVIQGGWEWSRDDGKDGPGGMRTERGVQIAFDFPLANRAYKVSCDFANRTKAGSSGSVHWETERQRVSIQEADLTLPKAETAWKRIEVIVTPAYSMAWFDGTIWYVAIAERLRDSRLTLELVGNLKVDNLCVGTVEPSDLPDFKPYQEVLDGVPSEERQGVVERFMVRPGEADKEVRLRFVAADGQSGIE